MINPSRTLARQNVSARNQATASSRLSTWEWEAVVGVLIAFAAAPGPGFLFRVYIVPVILLPAQLFSGNKEELAGNLIATNGGWAYMVQSKPAGSKRERPAFTVTSKSYHCPPCSS